MVINASSRVIGRYIAFQRSTDPRRTKKPKKTAEELSRELAYYNSLIAFHKETRRMIESKTASLCSRW